MQQSNGIEIEIFSNNLVWNYTVKFNAKHDTEDSLR